MGPVRSVGLSIWAIVICLLGWCFCCRVTAADQTLQRLHSEELTSDATKMKFVLIRAGTFTMGSRPPEPGRPGNEWPQHKVTITKPFHLGVYAVTQGEFSKVMGFNPSEIPGHDRMPVTKVNWYDAVLFCNELSKLDGLEAAYDISEIVKEGHHISSAKVSYDSSSTGYRLPTEAEWEYACRAGTSTPFVSGGPRDAPFPVDSFRPNPFGLYQMTGNVFEWVWDYYGEYSDREQTDPTGPDSNSKNERIRKGGSYLWPAGPRSCALRHNVPANFALFHMGFRVARTAPTPDASAN